MANAFNALRSKCDRAIAAYLVSVGAGSATDIVPANTRNLPSYPNTTVRSTLSRPEVPLTGIRRITVHISIKGSAVQDPKEPNQDISRTLFDARVAATHDAMMQSDDGQTLNATAQLITAAGRALAAPFDPSSDAAELAQNNADMADFTCQCVYDMGEGDGAADAEGCSWEEILIFEVVCSASNVD